MLDWCHSFVAGVLRGVDMARGLYFLVTPVPPATLRQVNCLLLGEITLPKVLLTVQVKVCAVATQSVHRNNSSHAHAHWFTIYYRLLHIWEVLSDSGKQQWWVTLSISAYLKKTTGYSLKTARTLLVIATFYLGWGKWDSRVSSRTGTCTPWSGISDSESPEFLTNPE